MFSSIYIKYDHAGIKQSIHRDFQQVDFVIAIVS